MLADNVIEFNFKRTYLFKIVKKNYIIIFI